MSDQTIAHAQSARGEVVLRRRARDGELELRVNGVFVMDSRETATERALAAIALEDVDGGPVRVLVGGLGLGYTLAELAASPAVGAIVVAEIEPSLVGWHLAGLVPATTELIRDSRIHLDARDVREVVGSQPAGSLDVIVLDVDNGPGFLVYDDNAAIYQDAFLSTCRDALADRGSLVVWSAAEAPTLATALTAVFGGVSHRSMPVTLGSRVETYHAYVAPGGSGDAALVYQEGVSCLAP